MRGTRSALVCIVWMVGACYEQVAQAPGASAVEPGASASAGRVAEATTPAPGVVTTATSAPPRGMQPSAANPGLPQPATHPTPPAAQPMRPSTAAPTAGSTAVPMMTTPSSDADAGVDEQPPAPGHPVPLRPAACNPRETAVRHAKDVDELRGQLIGDWQLCSTATLLCDDVLAGLSIRMDGTWADFEAPGQTRSGKWTPDVYGTELISSVTFSVDGADRSRFAWPRLSADGSVLRLQIPDAPEGCGYADYVRTGTVPAPAPMMLGDVAVEPLPPALQPTYQNKVCGPQPAMGDKSFESQAAMESALFGVWRQCASTSGLGIATDGIEIDADHRWYKLHADPAGKLWRGLGWMERGSWTMRFWETSNHQINFELDAGPVYMTYFIFSPDTQRVHVIDYVNTADYARSSP